MRAALAILSLALGGCTSVPAPEARYLTAGSLPICLLACTIVVTNHEAGRFPALREIGDAANIAKTTTSSSTATVSP